jgi:PhnB protein
MNTDMWDTPDLVPGITYADLPRAIEWLRRVFGFREREAARLTWRGGGMAWIETGNSLLKISTAHGDWRRSAGEGAASLVLKVYVDDVDRHFARAQAEGASIVSEPEDGFWGGRIYRALDHEGYQWEISQRGRDLSADRWQLPPGVRRGTAE